MELSGNKMREQVKYYPNHSLLFPGFVEVYVFAVKFLTKMCVLFRVYYCFSLVEFFYLVKIFRYEYIMT